MSKSDLFREKADVFLHQAAKARNLSERGRLIDEALRWRLLATDALYGPEQFNDNEDQEDPDGLAHPQQLA